jgi:hypothetical protein
MNAFRIPGTCPPTPEEFISKTIEVARKAIKEKSIHDADRYLRVRRFMFRKLYPGNDQYFVDSIKTILQPVVDDTIGD